MPTVIALAGNPNSGKTTLFNALTGSTAYVGNWPGVTVEKKEGRFKGNKDIIIQDLPGIYSLSPYTTEEVITRNYLTKNCPDVIINIIDASNIERNLYLTTQLLELDLPIVLALNMMDILEKSGTVIDNQLLKEAFGCEVFEISAAKEKGIDSLIKTAIDLGLKKAPFTPKQVFSQDFERCIFDISEIAFVTVPDQSLKRWQSIKLFEHDYSCFDSDFLSADILQKIEAIVVDYEMKKNDDAESIVPFERYNYINTVIQKTVKKKNAGKATLSDKIDQIVTNRIFALPIFAVVMYLIYYLSISTIGAWLSEIVSSSLFGSTGLPLRIDNFLESIQTVHWLNELIVNGIVAGVAAVIGFLPQMVILFICLGILEDCGYMTRIAFIMDRIFRKFGLSGKSFIPILIGTGCGVPGIIASRTIENIQDRRMTIITTTFIPCSAKLPIIALISGALFPDATWIAPTAYFVGIAAIIVSGIILKKTKAFQGEPAPFVMELPAYHLPRLRGIAIQVWERSKSFIEKAGTVILLASMFIWFLSSFNFSLQMTPTETSMLAYMGKALVPIFAPLGWNSWEAVVATLSGIVAKENLVSTFGILLGFVQVSDNGMEFWTLIQASFTQLSAFSFLVFNLLCAPCLAAIGAVSNEMNSKKWTLFALAYQTGFAYIVSFLVYQIGNFLLTKEIRVATFVSFFITSALIYLLLKSKNSNPHMKANKTTSI